MTTARPPTISPPLPIAGEEALQWLEREQTAGGRMPFLFTQGQAILTRTWIPTQDSTGIRQTYDAIVRVPEGDARHDECRWGRCDILVVPPG